MVGCARGSIAGDFACCVWRRIQPYSEVTSRDPEPYLPKVYFVIDFYEALIKKIGSD